MEFVTFEIAKKLKDLGFNEPFFFFYREDDKDKYVRYANVGKPLMYCNDIDDEVIIAPTISQALKWLREEKKVHIGFGYSPRKKWLYVVVYMDGRYYNQPTLTVDGFAKIEQAALAGIEYCIDNLI